jgi:hypothetical protein
VGLSRQESISRKTARRVALFLVPGAFGYFRLANHSDPAEAAVLALNTFSGDSGFGKPPIRLTIDSHTAGSASLDCAGLGCRSSAKAAEIFAATDDFDRCRQRSTPCLVI